MVLSSLVCEDLYDFGNAAEGESAIASILCGLGPRGTDPIPFEEIIYGSGRITAEDRVRLEH